MNLDSQSSGSTQPGHWPCAQPLGTAVSLGPTPASLRHGLRAGDPFYVTQLPFTDVSCRMLHIVLQRVKVPRPPELLYECTKQRNHVLVASASLRLCLAYCRCSVKAWWVNKDDQRHLLLFHWVSLLADPSLSSSDQGWGLNALLLPGLPEWRALHYGPRRGEGFTASLASPSISGSCSLCGLNPDSPVRGAPAAPTPAFGTFVWA